MIDEHKVGIEYNGLWWHGEFKVDRDYHYRKTIDSKSSNYNLIHIWSDDFLYKKDIVKSMILNRIGKSTNIIYSRKCIIKVVINDDKTKFLNDNHIQGTSNSQLNYGLYCDDILVSLMTFGVRYINGLERFELIRFCNKIYCNVVGSGNKLFKHFLDTNPLINEIVTYCDIAHFTGGVYEKMGFQPTEGIVPNYWWVVGGIRKNRYNYTKSKLVERGHDPNLSESEIMNKLGHYRVWGSGTQKWTYVR